MTEAIKLGMVIVYMDDILIATETMDAHLDTKVMSQIRKWGCHFDSKDPWAFSSESRGLKNNANIWTILCLWAYQN